MKENENSFSRQENEKERVLWFGNNIRPLSELTFIIEIMKWELRVGMDYGQIEKPIIFLDAFSK